MSQSKHINILIVDDEPLVRTGLLTILRQLRQRFPIDRIFEAGDGEKGAAVLQNESIDLIFTDIEMPKMDGLEFLGVVLKEYPSIPSVVLSCHDDFKYVRASFQYKVMDYVLKYDIEEETIAQLIEKTLKRRTIMSSSSGDIVQSKQPNFLESEDIIGVQGPWMLIRTDLIRISTAKMERIIDSFKCTKNGVKLERAVVSRDDQDEDRMFVILKQKPAKNSKDWVHELRRFVEKESGTSVVIVLDEVCKPSEIRSKIIHRLRKSMETSFYSGPEVIFNVCNRQAEPNYHDILSTGRMDLFSAVYDKDPIVIKSRLNHFVTEISRAHIVCPSSEIRLLMMNLFDQIVEVNKHAVPSVILEKIQTHRTRINDSRYLSEIRSEIETVLTIVSDQSVETLETLNISTGIRQALVYIHSHFQTSGLSLSEVADKIWYSHSYLSRQFKKEVHKSLVTYVNELRLKEARRLLGTGNYLVYEISEMVGFNNYNYFSKTYKNHFGVSPATDVKKNGLRSTN